MGSSKRKDRERESKKRHHRDETEEERRERKSKKKRKHDRHKHDKRPRSDDGDRHERQRTGDDIGYVISDGELYEPAPKHRRDDSASSARDQDVAAAVQAAGERESSSHGGGAEMSLGIEETNKLRVSLGLRPLDVTSSDVKKEEKESLKDDVHVPAENLAAKKQAAALKEKLRQIKEKREINKKLHKVKKLGESDEEEDSAAAWVEKSRKNQIQKDMAAKRARLLEEMDEEFGVSELVETEFRGDKEKLRDKAYTSRDLKGINVEHAQKDIAEGSTVILTLKDSGVLAEEGDTLVNINLAEAERTRENIELRKRKPAYRAYDDDAAPDGGALAAPCRVLAKYDEEIDGKTRSRFTLGSLGGADNVAGETEADAIRRRLQAQSLQVAPAEVAREYYTGDEMAAFRKPSRKPKMRRRVRKPSALTADDLEALALTPGGATDLGSRSRAVMKSNPASSRQQQERIPLIDDAEEMEMEVEDSGLPRLDEPEILGPEEDLTGVTIEEDDAEKELQVALHKARKMKQTERAPTARLEQLAEEMLIRSADAAAAEAVADDDDDDAMATADAAGLLNITLNSTSEYCRTLGDIPTYGQAGNRDDDPDELLDFERELKEQRRQQHLEDEQKATGWEEVQIDSKPVEIKDEDVNVLDEEPVAAAGIAAALELAKKKGYLEASGEKDAGVTRMSHLQAQRYTIEERSSYDIEDKHARRDRYAGPVTDFREKSSYRPDVRLTYIDDSGRHLNQKEAFRFLSHKFHGKVSGKMKTEKRAKKVEDELLMRKMSSTDTPLNTLSLLQDKQKSTQSAFIVLSGSGKGVNVNTIAKS